MQFHRTRLGEYHRHKAAFYAEARRVFGTQGQAAAAGTAGSPAAAEATAGAEPGSVAVATA